MEVSLIGFGGAANLPVWVGMERGHYAREGLQLSFHRTAGSREQMRELMAGTYQLCSTAFDNIVAYTEGQGADVFDGYDLKAIMGVHSGLNSVVVAVGVTTYEDIRDKAMAVDSPKSGYATVLYEIVRRRTGMEPERDYRLAIVGGTDGRADALREGRAAIAIVSSPQDIQLQREGFGVLGDAAEELGSLQGSCYGVRASWARANEQAVLAFVRATVAATDDVLADKPMAVSVMRARLSQVSEEDAGLIWDRLAGPGGFNSRASLNVAGMEMVLKLRRDVGSKAGEAARYTDTGYYARAVGSG